MVSLYVYINTGGPFPYGLAKESPLFNSTEFVYFPHVYYRSIFLRLKKNKKGKKISLLMTAVFLVLYSIGSKELWIYRPIPTVNP